MDVNLCVRTNHFANVYKFQAYLKNDLGIDVPVKTLKHWAEKKKGLISASQKQGLGRGNGSRSDWSKALPEVAGVWALRGGKAGRKTPRIATINKVKQFAEDVYAHPIVRLEIPGDIDENEDPPLERVELFFDYPPLPGDTDRSFLRRYLIAAEKALHGLHKDRSAIITFEWADQSKQKQSKRRLPFTKQLRWDVERIKTTVTEAPDGEDELRVLVDGEDVRKYLIAVRREDRTIRSTSPNIYEKWHLSIPKSFELYFAGEELRNVKYDKPTYDKITRDYKGKVTEGELRIRRRQAQFQEEFGVPAEVDEQFFKEIASEVIQKILRMEIIRLQDKIKHDRLDNSSVNTDLLSLSAELKKEKEKTILLQTLV